MVNDLERVRSAMLPLCEPLHDVFASAHQVRRDRLPELLNDNRYNWLATHVVRGLAHYGLEQRQDLLGDWRLSGNHAQNGALWMTNGAYRLRVLHTVDEVTVPPPGTNSTRRAYYRNVPLIATIPLFGEPNDKLLVLWRMDYRTGLPHFRVVRPIGNWNYGSRHAIDLDFVLPETAADLAGLKFEPTDEDLELELPLDEEQEGEDGAGGIAG